MKVTTCYALAAGLLLMMGTSRASAITRTWDGGGGTGSWHTAANWNPDGVPATGDDVVINVPIVGGVAYSTGTTTLNSLQCEQSLTVEGGTLVIESASSIRHLLAFAGALGGAGTLTVTGSMNWGTTRLEGAGLFVVAGSANVTISNPNGRTLQRTLNNFGTMLWTGGVLELRNALGTLNNHGSLTIDTSASELRIHANIDGGVINNFGTLTKSGLNDAYLQPCCGTAVIFNNAGTVHVLQDELTVMGGVHSGAIDISGPAGTALWFEAEATQPALFQASASLRGSGSAFLNSDFTSKVIVDGAIDLEGDLHVGAGEYTFNGPVSVGGTLTAHANLARFTGPASAPNLISGGLLVIDTPSMTVENLQFIDGEITGSGDLHITHSMTWQTTLPAWFSKMSGTGRTIIDRGAVMNIFGSSCSSERWLSRVLENHGTAVLDAGSSCTPTLTISDGTLINFGTLTIPVNGDELIERGPGSSSARIQNDGTLVKSGSGTLSL